jgi:hypothetical protein
MIFNEISKYIKAYDVIILLKVIVKYIISLSPINSSNHLDNDVFELIKILIAIYSNI